MKRAIGIGGIFFKAEDPKSLKTWYKVHLGIDTLFHWQRVEDRHPHHTTWNALPASAEIFKETNKDYVINYCVDDLGMMTKTLKSEGLIVHMMESDEHGKFGYTLDPDGNKVVLWEPNGKSLTAPKRNLDRVTGLGGVFFKTESVEKTKEWYGKHLGLPVDGYGASLKWIDPNHLDAAEPALTAWSPFKSDSKYFAPSEKSFMFNYRVKDLTGLFDLLKREGVHVVEVSEDVSYGKFGWIMDPEGNKIELWEP